MSNDSAKLRESPCIPSFANPVLIPARDPNVLDLIDAYICTIEAKTCSTFIAQLSDIAPLQESFRHVKRVRKSPKVIDKVDIFLAPVSEDIDGNDGMLASSKTTTPSEAMPSPLLDLLGSYPHSLSVIQVPRYPPQSKEDQRSWQKHCNWPVSICPPNKHTKRDAVILTETEISSMKRYMEAVSHVLKEQNCCNACVIVDPEKDAVVGVGWDETEQHPLKHAVMAAIDAVADWQKKVYWSGETLIDSKIKDVEHKDMHIIPSKGIEEDRFVQSDERKRQKVGNGRQGNRPTSPQPISVPIAERPYLCTGYDCYVFQEPCVMCAMALVHSRLQRVIFCKEDRQGGALGGTGLKLHSKRSLNHHYKVFYLKTANDHNQH